MKREELISQVKAEYANIASNHAQQHFHQTTTDISPEAYYEGLLNAVISEIGTAHLIHAVPGLRSSIKWRLTSRYCQTGTVCLRFVSVKCTCKGAFSALLGYFLSPFPAEVRVLSRLPFGFLS